ncbi:MAG: hypothetical protein ACI4B3_10225 [Prevotella sp.]
MQNELTYTLDIPATDRTFLLSLVKRMGWTAKKKPEQRICRLDEAIKAAHEDTLFQTRDIEVLMKSLME